MKIKIHLQIIEEKGSVVNTHLTNKIVLDALKITIKNLKKILQLNQR